MICRPLLAAAILATAPAFAQTQAPERFFEGETTGTGTLKVMMSKAKTLTDRGTGRTERDGTVVLDQVVEEPGAPTRKRQWRLRQTAPGKIEGTLSDAKGPVIGEFANNVLHMRYTMKDGVKVEQWLRLSPDGQQAANRMVFKKFGMTVATLEGSVRRKAR